MAQHGYGRPVDDTLHRAQYGVAAISSFDRPVADHRKARIPQTLPRQSICSNRDATFAANLAYGRSTSFCARQFIARPPSVRFPTGSQSREASRIALLFAAFAQHPQHPAVKRQLVYRPGHASAE